VNAVSDVLLLAGGSWMVLAAVGMLKFDDVISRMHVGTKATTLGLWLVLMGAALRLPPDDAVKLMLAAVLVSVTAPVGAHLVARAVHESPGDARVNIATTDELENPDT